MFAKGELVVYGGNGVCKITDITKMAFQGARESKFYYVLQPYYQKTGKIFTPVENEKSRMRQLISKEEAIALIDDIPNMEGLWVSNDKQREEAYKECIRSHECRACMKVMKTFYARKQERTAQGKKITATDERYFKQAEDSLYAELAVTLDIPREKMGDYIARRMEELQKQP